MRPTSRVASGFMWRTAVRGCRYSSGPPFSRVGYVAARRRGGRRRAGTVHLTLPDGRAAGVALATRGPPAVPAWSWSFPLPRRIPRNASLISLRSLTSMRPGPWSRTSLSCPVSRYSRSVGSASTSRSRPWLTTATSNGGVSDVRTCGSQIAARHSGELRSKDSSPSKSSARGNAPARSTGETATAILRLGVSPDMVSSKTGDGAHVTHKINEPTGGNSG